MVAVISDGGVQAQRVYIHDIDFFVNNLYNQAIRFDQAGCSGVIENLRFSDATLLAGGELIRLDGSGAEPGWTVRNNTLRTSKDGIVIEAGDVYIYGNEFINCVTAIEFTSDLGGAGVIGHNVYRDVTTPFVDADTDVVASTFADVRTATWSLPGAATVNTGVQRLYFPDRSFILAARLTADTAGTGTGFNTLDVHKNGTTIFTTQANRPTLAAGENDGGSQGPDVRAIAAGEYLTIDIDALTATTPAEDLVALVRFVEVPAT